MFEMNEVIELRKKAYLKMEVYGRESALMNYKGEEMTRSLSGDLGIGTAIISVALVLFSLLMATFLFHVVFIVLIDVFNVEILKSMQDLTFHVTLFSIIFFTLTSYFLKLIINDLKRHKRKLKEKNEKESDVKKIKAEMDNLFDEYDKSIGNLNISYYTGRRPSFYDNLSDQEKIVLREYQIKEEKKMKPKSELFNFYGTQKIQVIVNE